MQTYYQKTFVKISWDEELNCVHTEWRGFAFGQDVRDAMNRALQLSKEKGGIKALVDLSKFRITSQEDQEWIEKDWLPRAKALGQRYTAYIVPESALAKLTFEQTTARLASDVQSASFDNIEAAREWLRSK